MKKYLISLTFLAAVIFLTTSFASAAAVATVTFLQGRAFAGESREGPWQPVRATEHLSAGRYVKTDPDGIVELTLPDGSMIRLASNTVYGIDAAVFEGNQRRKFSGKLVLGRIWSKIRPHVAGLRDSYNVQTETAVVGVRGTVFNVDASADAATEVSVFDGRVGVAPPRVEAGAAREEIAWPTEVSEAEWEEIILSKLQRLHIAGDGTPGKPVAFDPEIEKDAWVEWNRERDKR